MVSENIGLYIDHIGMLVWIFVGLLAINDLRDKKLKEYRWARWVLLAISFIGIFIIDGPLLVMFYLGKPISDFAASMDYLGIPVFLFFIWLAQNDLRNKKIKNKFSRWIFLGLGIGGLIADGFIVFRNII